MRKPKPTQASYLWPHNRLPEAVRSLVRADQFFFERERLAITSELPATDQPSVTAFLQRTLASQRYEAQHVQARYSELQALVQKSAPALLTFTDPHETDPQPAYIVVLKSGPKCRVLATDHKTVTIAAEELVGLLTNSIDLKIQPHINDLLESMNLSFRNKEQVGEALTQTWIGNEILDVGWFVKLSPSNSVAMQLLHQGIIANALGWFASYNLNTLAQLLAWWLIGKVVFQGQADTVWLSVWSLVLLTAIPLQLLGGWLQSNILLTFGALFKQRSLFGILQLEPDTVRHLGSGGLIERVEQAQSLEMALGGGLSIILAVTQLVGAAVILASGPGGMISLGVLLGWLCLVCAAAYINFRQKQQWISTYRGMTNHLVENMLGHRTRLAQSKPETRHIEEDQYVEQYYEESRQSSLIDVFLGSLQTSWMFAGIASLLPSLIGVADVEPRHLAVGLGGVMMANQAFGLVQASFRFAISYVINWQQVKPIFEAAEKIEAPGQVILQPTQQPPANATSQPSVPLFSARNISFTFPGQHRPVLDGADVDLYPGDRVIMSGPSGGGKTTLAGILSGIREPQSGMLLLSGLDKHSLGKTEWRRKVVLSPQFNENHIFNDTFEFNLLFGRNWPPNQQDLAEADAICNELGLGDLLRSMPSGWHQIMGENGWRLSHGEQSRVFIARALLQNAEIMVLDESFGALDPENLVRALECVNRRAKTLVVIAHP